MKHILLTAVIAGAALSVCTSGLRAQECVQWSKYSCDEGPKRPTSATPPETVRLGILLPKDRVEPDPRKLYQVDVTCNTTQLLPAANRGIFNRSDVVTSHVVAITNKALTGPALPTDAKVLIPIYSVSTAQANQSNFTNDACNQSFFVSGAERLFIAATANQTRTNSPSGLSKMLYTGLKLFNPIAPLFAGAEAVAAVQPILNGIASTQAPLQEMFSHFDAAGTQTFSGRVFVGETNVRTEYSRTTIKVQEVPSIVQTANGRFIVSFEESLKGYSDELEKVTDEGGAKAKCDKDANLLLQRNFPGYDAAYGLTLVTRTAGLSPEWTLACLGKPYAMLSIKEFQPLWQKFKDRTRPITQADIDQYFENELPYPIQRYRSDFFRHLRNAMTDAAGSNAPDEQRTSLAKYFDDQIELRNSDRLLDGSDTPTTIASTDFVPKLTAKGITKFGCDGKDAQAAGILFGFKDKPKSGETYKDDEPIAIRTWIGQSGKITRVDVFSQPGLAEAVAKPTLMSCGRGIRLAGAEAGREEEAKK
jgi:hypothetical protein